MNSLYDLYNVYGTKKIANSLDRKIELNSFGVKKFIVAEFLHCKMMYSKMVISKVQHMLIILHELEPQMIRSAHQTRVGFAYSMSFMIRI